jgi:hypothetical protein
LNQLWFCHQSTTRKWSRIFKDFSNVVIPKKQKCKLIK